MNIWQCLSSPVLRISQRMGRFLIIALLLCLLMAAAACAAVEVAPEATATNAEPPTEAAAPADTPAAAATPVPAEEATVPRPETVAEGPASELQPEARNGMYTTAPEMIIDPSKFYYATFKSERGDIKAQLFADRAPLTVNNFVFLARQGFYNDTTFHRVLDGFMAQAGDPTGTGAGGPGYQFEDEIVSNLTFDHAGLLAMANAGPGTNGSQFFITFAATEWLNGNHTIFGEVIEGEDVLAKLTRRDPSGPTTGPGDTLYTVLIEESDESVLPPPPPTPTPTVTPTPFAPNAVESTDRPLAVVPPAERANYFNTAPEMVIDSNKQYTATIKFSSGEVVASLYVDEAPVAVNNFVVLARLGFFDGLPINQINPGQFVIFGSPDQNPANDAGYRVAAEVNLPVEMATGVMGYIPMRGPTPNASSSQLLIALIPPPAEVNADFSFFGRIVSGNELLLQLANTDTVESVTITESE
ncbi:MAG: peptidylprolyl isomerase [Caldilineaceae bacterium]